MTAASSLGDLWVRWMRNVRSSLRSLARAPVYTLTIIATLAVGIGGTTAVFGVVDSVLIQPLPHPDPSELVRISNHSRGQDYVFSVADYLALEEQQTQFEDRSRRRPAPGWSFLKGETSCRQNKRLR